MKNPLIKINKKLYVISPLVFALVFIFTPFFTNAITIQKNSSSLNNNTLRNGLVGYWTFDGSDVTDKVYDKSGNEKNGGFYGGATSSAKVAGVIGQALSFDGIDDQISFTSNDMDEPITFSAWFNSASTSDGTIVSLSDGGFDSAADNWRMGIVSGKVVALSQRGAGPGYASSVTTIQAGKWYHAVAVIESGTLRKIYVNGVFEAQNTDSEDVGGTNTLGRIGSYNNGGETGFFKGILDDVRIYNRALSDSEIKQLYTVGASKFNTPQNITLDSGCTTGLSCGLIGYWTLDGKDITDKVYDKSGNGNHGGFYGSATSSAKVSGKIGQGLFFNGTNSRVKIANNIADNIPRITVAAWIKMTVADITSGGNLISKGRDYTSTFSWRLGKTSADVYTFSINNGTTFDLATSYTSYQDQKWHHIVGVYNGSNIIVYVDGIPGTPVNFTGTINNLTNYPICIGSENADSTGGCNSIGLSSTMDDVRIYNRALSTAEIKQLYNSENTKYGVSQTVAITTGCTTGLSCGLIGYWTLDGKDVPWTNATNSTVIDKSGYGQTFTSYDMYRSTSPVPGKIGQGLKFDGTGDYLGIAWDTSKPIYQVDGAEPFSISAWIYPETLDLYQGIIGRYFLNSWLLSAGSDNVNSIGLFINGTRTVTPANSVSLNMWTHVVGVFTGTRAKIYLNGSLSVDSPITVNMTEDYQIVNIGTNPCCGNLRWKGKLDDIRFYNRALSDLEIKQLYNQ